MAYTLSEPAARRLTHHIRLLARSHAEQSDKILGLIDEPRTGRADTALGYPPPALVVPGGEAPRRPLADTYRDLTRDVLKAVDALARLHQDDRFRRDRQAVQRHLPAVNHAAARMLDVRDVLGSDETGSS